MMRLFLHELRMSWKVALLVNIGTVLLVGVGMMKYPGFTADPIASVELLEQFPKIIFAVIGMSELDLTTITGFYSVLFFYVLLIGAAYATSLGINCVAREENEQTIEFLLVKPISRWYLLMIKFLVAIFWLVIYLIFSAVATLISLEMIEIDQTIIQEVSLATISLLPRFILYASIGLLSATFLRKATTGGVIAYVFFAISWNLNIFYVMFEEVSWFEFLTPFQFYATTDLLTLTWSWPMTFYSLGLVLIVTALGFWRYQTTDVRVR